MSATKRKRYGSRKAEAVAFIKLAEKKARLWSVTDLAEALKVSKQQAWQLCQSLTYSGLLERGPRTVVVEDALRLTPEAA